MVNVTINIESVFSQFATVKELKEVAQGVINQVNAAYKARLVQIQKASEKEQPAQVPVSVSSNGTKTAKATPKNTKQPKKTAPKVEEPAKETTTEKKPKEEVKQVSISSLTKAQIKAMNIKFEHYSEKCMFLTGNTRCIKDEIKATGKARWNNHRQGWFVGNDAAKELGRLGR